jgi:hypothetical protein
VKRRYSPKRLSRNCGMLSVATPAMCSKSFLYLLRDIFWMAYRSFISIRGHMSIKVG